MQIVYKKLVEVEIEHDYFIMPGPALKYTLDYDISKMFSIRPSTETQKLFSDLKIVFKNTATGFVLLVKAEFINSITGFATAIDLDDDMVFSFYWTLNDSYFVNYTNQRLIESNRKIYYFSSRTGTSAGAVSYLNTPVKTFGVTYQSDPLYRLGDIVINAGATYELIEKESPIINFAANAAKWQKIDNGIVNFVNPDDRIRLVGTTYTYSRVNSRPGEFISMRLQDVHGNWVPPAVIPGTATPQNEFRTSWNAAEDVQWNLDLSHIPPGFYTLEISDASGLATQALFIIDPFEKMDVFGVTQLFISGASNPFQFVKKDLLLNRWILDDPNKKFTIRFRNRMTFWRYLLQDASTFTISPAPRPLTKIFSGFTVPGPGGTAINLPDPGVNQIIPELDVATKLVKNIYSNIFLTK